MAMSCLLFYYLYNVLLIQYINKVWLHSKYVKGTDHFIWNIQRYDLGQLFSIKFDCVSYTSPWPAPYIASDTAVPPL
jgi:hypothetical protein